MEAKQRGAPPETLAKLLADLSEEDREAAKWVYCEAHRFPHVVSKPDQVDVCVLEGWIRRRHDAARPKIARSQHADVLEDYFNCELVVLRSLLPPRPPTVVGWEEPWPHTHPPGDARCSSLALELRQRHR